MSRTKQPEHRGLTGKQQRFVQEYLVDLNATQAAIRAGYSAHTAGKIASEILKHPQIARAIQAAQSRRAERVQGQADDIERELVEIAFADPRRAFSVNAKGEVIVKPDPTVVESLRERIYTDPRTGRTRRVVSVKFRDRLAALMALGERLGAF